ncbi:type IV secretory system conjugative DNA transfer family protein [Paenarthrobacter nicotinovorans]|uniref:type IV secretory system conjugative DNA transfer family protein n=1 Tax=Paenarthrobacter nicotinovorans TaxID=29320 RepID=UPI0011A343E6|nr:FtsK/SpoIIIE domain-containing protein [Paenarthrobacter nicotinovorans]
MSRILDGPPRAMGSEPAYGLTPRPPSWPRLAFLSAAATVVVGISLVLTKQENWVAAAMIAGLLVTGVATAIGFRTDSRRALADRFTEAVCPRLGSARPIRDMVRLSRWKGWWTGAPERISLRYDSAINQDDPQWRQQIAELTKLRLGGTYQMHKVSMVKGRVHLRLVPDVPEAEESLIPEVVVRAEAIVQKAFSAGAKAKVELGPDGSVARVDVAFQIDKRFAREFNRYDTDSTVMSMLPGRWRSRWDLESDQVVYELRKPLPEAVPHPPITVLPGSAIENYDKVRVPFAIDEDGRTHFWEPAINPHFLVVGTSGSGKTVCMHGIVAEFTAQGWPVWVVDGKATEFIGFRRWENVQLVGTYISEQVRVIHMVHTKMEERIRAITEERATEDDFEPLLLVIDEFKAFKFLLTMLYKKIRVKGDPTEPEALGLVSDIASRGRSIRIHLLLGTQRPDAAFLTGEMRDNFGARLSMGRLNREGAQMMWGNPRTGVALPRKARGRGVTSDENSNPVEVQVYWTPDPRKATAEKKPKDYALLETLRPEKVTHPRMQVIDPEELPDLDGDSETIPVTYQDWASARITVWTGDQAERPRSLAALPVAEAAAGSADEGEFVDWEIEYADLGDIPVTDVEDGDLLCLDETTDVWVAVESVFTDPEDESNICVDWRSDDDETGSESFPDDAMVTVRRAINNMGE